MAAKQSELEKELQTMKDELATLKSSVPAPTPPVTQSPVPSIHLHSPVAQAGIRMAVIAEPHFSPTPLTPVSQYGYPPPPAFVEGSSSHPYDPHTPSTPHHPAMLTPQMSHIPSAGPSTHTTPSPTFMPRVPSPNPSNPPSEVPRNPRKRNTPPSSDSNDDSEEESDAEGTEGGALPRKRLNGHDKRCLTIQVSGDDPSQDSLLMFVFPACNPSALPESDEDQD